MLKYHIQTIEVGSGGAASVTFNGIPQAYDDLLITLSARSASGTGQPSLLYRVNNSSSGYSSKVLFGYTSGVVSGTTTTLNSVAAGGDWGRLDYEGFSYATSTSNTFSNIQFYIPNYKSLTAKAASADITVADVSATPLRWWVSLAAPTWTNAQPVSSISFALYEGTFAQYSSISMYGVKAGVDGVVQPVATGGAVTTSGGFTIHTFTSSSTFVANRDLDVEYLVIAGGGGGGYNAGGGGGAGGYRSSVQGELSGGNSSAESRLRVSSGISQLVLVGAGGAGGGSGSTAGNAASGSDSSFANIVSTGGGRGAGNSVLSASGGSGGGAGFSGTGGAGTTGQGFAGASHNGSSNERGGGGGAGEAGNTDGLGAGGDGIASTITGSSVIRAGGGGGGSTAASSSNVGGDGGGGAGGDAENSPAATAGTANTGGGGGGGASFSVGWAGAAGGSGVVIIRYPTPA